MRTPRLARVPRPVKVTLALIGAWALLSWGSEAVLQWLLHLDRLARDAGWLSKSALDASVMHDILFGAHRLLVDWTLAPFLFALTLAVPLAALVRMLARGRMREGFADPLDAVRAWTLARPKATRRLLAMPALLCLMSLTATVVALARRWGGHGMYGDYASTQAVRALHRTFVSGMAIFWCVSAVAAIGMYAATRAAFRTFLSPTLDREKRATRDENRIVFDAVAVTTETRAAVIAMALLPVVVVAIGGAARLGDTGMTALLAAYAATALGGAFAFRRASRVAVGLDGVFVTGTSRTRFFPYKDIDTVKASGNEIRLSGGGKVLLRLQLHGEDATERDAIALRIQEAIACVENGASSAAGGVVSSSSGEQLARAALGAVDYRAPALTREQLWTLVEGPEQGETRMAAARALASTGTDAERARIRVAAERCAEPHLRVDMERLASGDDDPAEGEPDLGAVALRIAR